jgi:hypothetical protein
MLAGKRKWLHVDMVMQEKVPLLFRGAGSVTATEIDPICAPQAANGWF